MSDEKAPKTDGQGNAAPPPIDPWEARERERARYSQASARRHRDDTPFSFGGGGYLATGLVCAVAALLIGESPFVPASLRSILTVGGSVIVLLLLASARSYADNLWLALRRGPNPFLLGLILWSVVAYFVAPLRDFSSFGASEILRVLTGVGVYFLAAYGLRSPREVASATVGLIGVAVLVALADFWQMGETKGALDAVRDRNLFGTHENLGALLLMALPVSLSFSLSGEIEDKRRIAAQAATLVLISALLLARARSAWIGTGVSIALLSLLLAMTTPRSGDSMAGRVRGNVRRNAGRFIDLLASPAVLIGIGLVVLIGMSGAATILRTRASLRSALTDPTMDGRVILWKAAARMAYDRPWTGWGLGSYWLIQGRWTHVGGDVGDVLQSGAYQENNAHDYYLQWAADTGAPGLFLYTAAVTAFIVAGAGAVRKLGQVRSEKPSSQRPSLPPFQRLLLLGCLASVVGAAVDAIASPAYMFHGISSVFWLVVGLGVSSMRPVVAMTGPIDEDAPAPIPALPAVTFVSSVETLLPSLAVVGLILFLGHRQHVLGEQKRQGVLSVSAEPAGKIYPGQTLTWRAIFHDETGKETSTCPGTLWEFNADKETIQLTKARFGRLDTQNGVLDYSELIIVPPATRAPITAHAIYFDAYGRRYDAWSEIHVSTRSSSSSAHSQKPSKK